MRVRAAVLPVALVAAVAFLLQPGSAQAATPKFLTLPFPSGAHIHIQRAWWTVGSTPGVFNALHHGIDYIYGKQDQPSTWKSFPVYAAAAGDACGVLLGQTGCVDFAGEVMGNRVLIRHEVNGQTFYTWYNHLKSIVPSIPLGSRSHTVHVARGQLIGYAGASGNAAILIHLHFELENANLKPIDPYGIYGWSRQYPDPAGKNSLLSKPNSYWISNPPTVLGATPFPSASPKPTRTPKPTRAPPTPVPATPGPGGSSGPTPSAGTGGTSSPGTGGTSSPAPGDQVTPVPGSTDTSPPTSAGTTSAPDPAGAGTNGGTSSGSGPGLLLAAIIAAILIAGAAIVLVMRRRRSVPPPGQWRP